MQGYQTEGGCSNPSRRELWIVALETKIQIYLSNIGRSRLHVSYHRVSLGFVEFEV